MSANLIAQLNVKTQGMVDKSGAYCRPEVAPMLPVMRDIRFNSSPIAATLMRAAVVLLIVVAASTAGWAAETICPASPNYSPDFTLNRGCLPPNGSATFPAPAGSTATITSWGGASGIVTFQATNSFVAGEPIILSGFVNSTFFNGLVFPVLAAGLTNTQFEIAFSSFSGSSDTGAATPVNLLQLTSNSTDEAGSAWYSTEQTITNAFSTTFTFQLSGATNTLYGNADGIAFVIQDSGATALGPDGCGMGFADGSCTSASGGIQNSLAVAFKTFNDGYPSPNNNSVLIVSNGTGANCIDESCSIAYNNGLSSLGITLADGNIHTATISYTLTPTLSSSPNCFSGTTPEPCLDVILDGVDLFDGGVQLILNGTTSPVSLQTLIGSSGTAYVGFTGGTGGGDDNQDVLSWTFTPQAQSQTGSVSPTTTATYSYNGGCTDNGTGCTGNGYTNTVSENPASTLTIGNLVVTPIPIVAQSGLPSDSQALCNAIVNPPGISPEPWVSPSGSSPEQTAQCFVYTNGGGTGIDAPVMFAVSCPPSGICDTTENQFFAAMASYFTYTCTENPPLIAPTCSPVNSPSSFGNFGNLTTMTGLPSIGFLQGAGPDANNPCNPATGSNPPPLFQSNQIVSYTLGDTSSKPVKGGSTLLSSCWVATYDTPGEMPTASISGPTNGAIYQQGAVVPASYTCNAVSTAPDSTLGSSYPSAGPYLTVSTCSATSGSGGGSTSSSCTATYPPALNMCNGTINLDTTDIGPQTLTVDVEDSATNTAQQQVTYTVVGATDVAIANVASPITTPGSKLTYVIGVGDLGSVNALNTIVNDTLSAGTTFVSASGSNVACSIVGKKLTCPSTPISCTSSGSNVSCDVGTIMPLSLSDLNGAVISITVKVTATGTIKNPTLLSNTATVSESNTDTKPSNNTATAKTNVE